MQIELKVEVRETRGKGAARKARAGKQIPAVFYGPHMKEPVCLSLDAHEYMLARSKSTMNTVYKLVDSKSSSGVTGKMALLKSEQLNPLNAVCEHIDLYEVREGEKIKVRVPVALVGKSIGAAEGGIVQVITRILPVRCLPQEIPLKIEVDITNVGLNESLHVSDITLPKGVSVAGTIDYTLVAVLPPEAEAKKADAPAAAAATAAAPAAGAKAAEAKPAAKK